MPIRLVPPLLAAAGALAPAVHAQAPYPAKPIRMLVGSPPGGPSDIVTRLFAEQLTQSNKQPVVVENRPGVGNSLAAGEAGKLTALAVSSLEPSPRAPDLPTLAKALNQPTLDISFKLVLQAARGTPAPVIAERERAAIEIMKKPEVRAKLQASDLVAVGSTHADAEAL